MPVIVDVLNFLLPIIEALVPVVIMVAEALTEVFTSVGPLVGTILDGLLPVILSLIDVLLPVVKWVLDFAVAAIQLSAALSPLALAFGDSDEAMKLFETALDNMAQTLFELPGMLWDFLGDAGTWLFDIGAKIIGGLIDGISSMFGAVGGIVDRVKGMFGFDVAPQVDVGSGTFSPGSGGPGGGGNVTYFNQTVNNPVPGSAAQEVTSGASRAAAYMPTR